MIKDGISNVFESEKERANLEKLDSFYALKKDWNLYNADPVPDQVIDYSKEILQKLIKQPDEIFPTAAKSIQFEYDNEILCNHLEFDIRDYYDEDGFYVEWLVSIKNPESANDVFTYIDGTIHENIEDTMNELILKYIS